MNRPESEIVIREDGTILLDGLLPIDELKDLLDMDELPEEEKVGFQTVGGFMMNQIGSIPKVGQHFHLLNFRFEVMDMDDRRVDKVLLSKYDTPRPHKGEKSMIPVRLQIKGFLSYQESVDLNFEEIELACISGSNGAGKSSLLDAITWVLFGEARRRDDTVINHRSQKENQPAEVILDFEYENSLYRVQRSKLKEKATVLNFFIRAEDKSWKPLTEATLRATEERIRQTLRLDYETFTNASFFLQGKADQFAQQKPADRKRILANILGLEIWEKYKDEALHPPPWTGNRIGKLRRCTF